MKDAFGWVSQGRGKTSESGRLGWCIPPNRLGQKLFTKTGKTVERITERSERKDPRETFMSVFFILRPTHMQRGPDGSELVLLENNVRGSDSVVSAFHQHWTILIIFNNFQSQRAFLEIQPECRVSWSTVIFIDSVLLRARVLKCHPTALPPPRQSS